MIKQLDPSDFPRAAEVIRESFATVAKDFGFTEENFPNYAAFDTTAEKLHTQFGWGWHMYGLYEGELLAGYVSLCKSREDDNAYELHNLAVLPKCRHKGGGRQLLDICKEKAKDLGGYKITLGMIEENTALKNWYTANGFIHAGTKRFEHLPFTVGFMEWEVK